MDPKSLFSLSDHFEALSKEGDPLEVLQETVDFEYFRGWLVDDVALGQDPQALFTMLYRSTDCCCRAGAPM